MFNTPPLSSPFSVSNIVGGLSKTLGLVNQIIPLYKEAKPMIQNARNTISLIKEFSNTTTNKIKINTEKNIAPLKEKVETIKNINEQNNLQNKKGPTFFL